MEIAFDCAGGNNGQGASAENKDAGFGSAAPDAQTIYQLAVAPKWFASSTHISEERGIVSIDELDRLSNSFDDDFLFSSPDNLVCSLSRHNRMTQQIALDTETLKQFVFILSHKLRAPIANALGLAELLESKVLSDEERVNCQEYLCASVRAIDAEIKAMNEVMTQYMNRIRES